MRLIFFVNLLLIISISFSSFGQENSNDLDKRVSEIERKLGAEIKYSWISGGHKRRSGRYVNFGITYDDKVQLLTELSEIAHQAQIDGNSARLNRVKFIAEKFIPEYANPSSDGEIKLQKAFVNKLLTTLQDKHLNKMYMDNVAKPIFVFENLFLTMGEEQQMYAIEKLLKTYVQSRDFAHAASQIIDHIANKKTRLRLGYEYTDIVIDKLLENNSLTVTEALAKELLPLSVNTSKWDKYIKRVMNDSYALLDNNVLDILKKDPTYQRQIPSREITMNLVFKVMRRNTDSFIIKMKALDVFENRDLGTNYLGDKFVQNGKEFLEEIYRKSSNSKVKDRITRLYIESHGKRQNPMTDLYYRSVLKLKKCEFNYLNI